jgi:hypothetical protein
MMIFFFFNMSTQKEERRFKLVNYNDDNYGWFNVYSNKVWEEVSEERTFNNI